MSSTDETLLCRYRYDPLDRLADSTPSAHARTQRFYLKERLTSEIQGSVQRSIFQQKDQLLAQQQRQDDAVETTLLATDQQRSVLQALDATRSHPLAYTPYGHRAPENGLLSLLGFNGERPDPVTGHYLLGNGYRAFNPVLMRFNSPDSLSPFGKGGLNAYSYSQGNPVNRTDPTGHFSLVKPLLNILGLRTYKKTVIVHGIELRVPANKPLKAFIEKPTEKYERKFDISLIEDWGIQMVIDDELQIIASNTNIIENETEAATMIKELRATHANRARYKALTVQIKRDRAQYKEDLENFNQSIRQSERPPSYGEVFEQPLPSYKPSF
jgi:RHS repeat-associated protein